MQYNEDQLLLEVCSNKLNDFGFFVVPKTVREGKHRSSFCLASSYCSISRTLFRIFNPRYLYLILAPINKYGCIQSAQLFFTYRSTRRHHQSSTIKDIEKTGKWSAKRSPSPSYAPALPYKTTKNHPPPPHLLSHHHHSLLPPHPPRPLRPSSHLPTQVPRQPII
jgi:hypothetical protein